ncbi:MAG: hypothetical protein KatS3mg011_0304 [Acidimicrobiia bacterium]|nr:MAG: hypothetical protein KatS3mg011_0304 [Acidimicrobiia bacterium]
MAEPASLVAFARELRAEGIGVGPSAAADLLAAMEAVGAASAEDVYWAFRSTTVTSREQVPAFDRVFVRFFRGESPGSFLVAGSPIERTWRIRTGEEGGEGEGGRERASTTGASLVERLGSKDFAELTDEEKAEVRALIAQMLWEPSPVSSRRRRPSKRGDRPDMRRTLRRAVGVEGDLLRIETTRRRLRRRPLILLADVSGSMEQYSEMLLYFAHAAQARFGRLEAFVFSTRLTRITRQMRNRDPSKAIREVAETVSDWSGGTRIGEAVGDFNRLWSRRMSRGSPVVLIVSDGWECGDPAVLAEEMGRLQRTMHRVIWLNPLAGRAGYAPETRGMRAALPYVDHFLAAGNLQDLETLVGLLESIPMKR